MHSASSQSLGIVVGAVTRFLKTDDKTEEVDITHLIDLIKKKDYDFYSRSASIVLENPTSNGLVIS